MTEQQHQADSVIHEDQLLNCLINALTGEFSIISTQNSISTPSNQSATRFFGSTHDFDFEVKAVYVDSEFYDGNCLTLIQAHNHAYVMPIIKWGTKIQRALSDGWSREIEHDLTTEYGDHEWTVEFPVMIDCTVHSDGHSCSMERTFGTARRSSKQAT